MSAANITSIDTGEDSSADAQQAMYMQDMQQWLLSLVVCIVGGIGNGILLLAHFRRRPPLQGKMKVAMQFMVSMAAVDFAVCVIILPIEIITFANEYRNYPDIVCKIFAFGRLVGLYSSNFLLIAIAIDRYISVCRPFSTGITFSTAKYITYLCLLGGVVVAAPNLYLFKVTISPDMKMQRCQMTEVPNLEMFRRFCTFFQLAIFILSVAVIVTLYSLVYKNVYKKEKRRQLMRQATSKPSQAVTNVTTSMRAQKMEMSKVDDEHDEKTGIMESEGKRQKQSAEPTNNAVSRMAFMLVLVTAVFVFSWLPYWIINLVAMTNYFHGVSKTQTLIALFFSSLFYINNAVNPIIYTFASSSFRKDIKRHAFCRPDH